MQIGVSAGVVPIPLPFELAVLADELLDVA